MSSQSKLNAECILDAVKAILKERGIRYSHLASELDCSLPTIKRSLNNPSLTLMRVLEIAEVAGVGLADVIQRAERMRPKHYVFTPEQDQLFADREELLTYFVELSVKQQTPRSIAERNDLDIRSTNAYQKLLEGAGLLKRRARNQVKLLVKPPFGFDAQGPYMKKRCQQFLESIIVNVVDKTPPHPDCTAIIKPLELTEDDHKRLIQRLVELIDQFAAISERRIGMAETSSWQLAIACGPSQREQPTDLPRITK